MSADSKAARKFTISQFIDSFGVSKFTISIFFLVGIAMMFDGYDYMIISYTNTQIMQEFFGPAGNDALKGALSSWSTIGIVVGSFAAGPLSDKFGRRKILTFGTFMYGLFTIPCIFAPSYELFSVFRVIAGLFLGVCTPIVTTLFTEFTPTKQRSFFITFGMAWMIVGWVFAALIGTIMVQVATWHWCYAIGAFPVVYAFIFGKFTPESAHWAAVHGKMDLAVSTLKCIQKRSGKDTGFEIDAANILVPPVAGKASPAEVWKGRYLKTTIALVIIYFAGNFSIYGVNAWLPALMLEATGGAVTASYMLAMAQNAASVVANCTTGFVSEAMGRKRNLTFGYGLAVVACLIVSQVVKLPTETSFWPYLIAFVFMGFALNYAITAAQPMMSESYPTEFRNSGVATIVALGKSAGILSPVVLGGLKAAGWAFSPLIALLAVPMAFGFAACFLLPKGAKGMNIDDIAEAVES
ncbi:MFS transporter [Paraeggerthella sp. Marseille-Q4926]|uniref:MFS transporter n=1 Tax=Paraeggerthella sp. Marseille-Q4926 TaxID=2866587 RepID=UPI001CE46C91|nr:MFS transporter [Paraeggerthella sp. Marseille-Q4926]